MAVKRDLHTTEEIKEVLDELERQTDRGVAIIAASVIEELLAVVIQRRLLALNSDRRKSLFDRPNAPLSSFSAKIELGYALGLYSDVASKHLHILRECRNRFAHRVKSLNFNHPDIVEIISPVADHPFYAALATNRDRYLAVVRTMAMIFIAECAKDIKISELGQTDPDIFVELLARLWPEKASELRELLRQMNQSQA